MADERARRLVAAMTLDEKIGLLHTPFGLPLSTRPAPKGSLGSAGFNAGIPRLGIPPLQETDAELGIANPTNAPFVATAMPCSLALAATFDPDLARRAGAVVGAEARARGFNVVLGGAANLIREPRGGRNFEYLSEDPLLTGVMAGSHVAGVQSQHVISTVKHFALNAQENGRLVLNAKLAEAPFREADLLAFEIAIEKGAPGSVMTAYNVVNDTYPSESAFLLSDVLKRDWGYPGWVMSDWSGTHSTVKAALAGLDQQSGEDKDPEVYFGAPLKAAVLAGRVPMARIDDMVVRLLRTQIQAGLFEDPPHAGAPIDYLGHDDTARTIGTRGIVLLKNEGGILPLAPNVQKILLVGGHADIGVMSGGGSSEVVPKQFSRYPGIPARLFYGLPILIDGSSPYLALKQRLPDADIRFSTAHDPDATLRLARNADVVIYFGERWSTESMDLDSLSLPFGRNDIIAKLAAANPRTIVVLETPSGVTMPWLPAVKGVLEAWYPGQAGGDAIADILTGRINPSGRLPVTFAHDEKELPRPVLPSREGHASFPQEVANFTLFDVDYNIEGADVGYKWYLRKGRKPLFPFGYGLSYTQFESSHLAVVPKGNTVEVSFDVANIGARAGTDVPQVYIESTQLTRRLVGWSNVTLAPNEKRHVSLSVDPRLLAHYSVGDQAWQIADGTYTVSVRENAMDEGLSAAVQLKEDTIPAKHGPCGAGAVNGALCVGTR
jgi:beta-glucosidase